MKSLQTIFMALIFTVLSGTHANAQDHFDSALYIGYADSGRRGYADDYDEAGRDRYGRDHDRRGYRSYTVCREFVEVVRGRHGRYHEVVRSVCRDRDNWHRPHRHDHYSDGRNGRYGRW